MNYILIDVMVRKWCHDHTQYKWGMEIPSTIMMMVAKEALHFDISGTFEYPLRITST